MSVHTTIGIFDFRVRDVLTKVFERDRLMVVQIKSNTSTELLVEFKDRTQVRQPNACGSDSRAGGNERINASTGREDVTQTKVQAKEIIRFRMILQAADQLAGQFQITAIPMIARPRVIQNPGVFSLQIPKIVRLFWTAASHAKSTREFDFETAGALCKAVANVAQPDAFRLMHRFKRDRW